MGIGEILKAIIALIPIFKQLIAFFTRTPAEKRDKLIVDLQAGFKKALESDDTSDLENTIRRGKG